MQAPSNLSPEQKHALESTFVFLSAITPFLQSLTSIVQPNEKALAGSLYDLAGVTGRKLLLAFPEITVWLAEWEHPGGVA